MAPITPEAESLSSSHNDRVIPASLSKYFKTTAKAQKLMDPEGRLCELDRQSQKLELVYSTHRAYRKGGWRQMQWSQAMLWKAAQDGEQLHVLFVNLRWIETD